MLADLTEKWIYINSVSNTKIEFDLIFDAEVEIYEIDRHNDNSDLRIISIKISATGDLANDLNNFEITNVMQDSGKSKHKNPLSDSLVPIIEKEQFENIAKSFLEKYYKEALYNPMPVKPQVLAQRMGLIIEKRNITPDLSVFGKIIFKDCLTDYFNKDTNEIERKETNKGTVIVDPDAYFLRNVGSVNNTIVHECVHWDLHRKVFELERLCDKDVSQLQCEVKGGIKGVSANNETGWMEWQANSITPRILMPYTQTKVKAKQLIEKYKDMYQTDNLIDIMEFVIDELAVFYDVSRCAAKIRMIDLGYEEAIGTFTYIDGKYVKPHTFTKGVLQRNQTFCISQRDAIAESNVRPTLLDGLRENLYVYVDSHFCINDPKYVNNDSNENLMLTDYARNHIDECCLIFNLSIQQSAFDMDKEYYTECTLCRDDSSQIVFVSTFADSMQNQTVDQRAKTISKFNKESVEVISKLPNSFGGRLVELMKWRNITNEKLAEEIKVDPKTIQRLRNITDNVQTTIETVVSICIALKLPPMISDCLIEKSGMILKNNETHMMYRYLLYVHYNDPLEKCNELLIEQNITPLGGDE